MDENVLTWEKFQEAMDLLWPPLYYGLDKNIERGHVYHVKESNFNAEAIVLHPDDLSEVKRMITTRRLVDLKDEPVRFVFNRALRNLGPTPFVTGQYYSGDMS